VAIEATRDNSLFLSVADAFNLEDAKTVIKWFWKLRPIDGLDTDLEGIQTVELLQNPEYAEKVRQYLGALGLGILDIDVKADDFDEKNQPDLSSQRLKSELAKHLSGNNEVKAWALHRLYDQNGKPTTDTRSWTWNQRESSGSIKALELSGPVLWSLANGGVLLIDEIEAKLHPIMTLKTIELFLDPASNPNHTQLVFATHDTNLLTYP
jgi:hypothetical protein